MTPLILALLAAALFQFLYQATLLSLSGRTLGKLAAGIQVRSKFGGRKPSVGRALGRAAITTLTETGLLSIACILVCLGQFRFGVGVWGLAVVGFWANALVGVSRGNRTMGDRVSGTAEFRTGMYARAAEMTVDVARRTSNAASERTLDIARKTSDAVVVAGQLTREGADHIVQSELVQRALSSKSAQQVQALGSASVDGARRVAGQVGRRARVAWEERQTGREPK